MTLPGWLQIALLVALVGALVIPLGGYMAKVFSGERTFTHPVLRPIEVAFYRLCQVESPRSRAGSPMPPASWAFTYWACWCSSD